jgi:hypothetical protein
MDCFLSVSDLFGHWASCHLNEALGVSVGKYLSPCPGLISCCFSLNAFVLKGICNIFVIGGLLSAVYQFLTVLPTGLDKVIWIDSKYQTITTLWPYNSFDSNSG